MKMNGTRYAILAAFLIIVLLGSNQSIQSIRPESTEEVEVMPDVENFSAPSETGSSTSLRANMVRNGGFEDETLYETDGAWSRYTSFYREVEFDYQDEVSNGSYSCLLEVEGTDFSSGYTQIAKDGDNTDHFMGNISEGSVLNVSYNILDNPNLAANGQVWVYIRLYNGSYYYLYYYLSSSFMPGVNSTDQANYFLNTTEFAKWNHLSRNITSDFEDASGTITTDLKIEDLKIRISSPSNPVGTGRLVLDDVHLRNGTDYEYILNGGFETGDNSYWYRSSNSVKGDFSHSSISTEGNNAANISVSTNRTGAYGYAEIYHIFDYRQAHYALASGTLTVEFDWYYQETINGGSGQYARYTVWFENESYSGAVYWYLGASQDEVTYLNNTGSSYGYYYLPAAGFGTRDTWSQFEIDIYEVFAELNLTQASITQGELSVRLGSYANSSVSLLVDRYSMNTYPIGDPGFEVDYAYSDNIPSWWNWIGSKSYWTQSSDSLVGDYAVNATITLDATAAIFRRPNQEIDQWTYTDFSWRLDVLDSGSDDSYAMIEMHFEGGYRLRYMLASHGFGPGNGTYDAYYYVDGFNTTGTWMSFQRNITNDLNASFGIHQWNLTRYLLYTNGASGGKLSILFDELHFMDVKPPDIQSISQTPSAPEYTETTNIYVEATDNLAGIKGVSVFYRDSGGWIETVGEYTIGKYTVTLPPLAYGISREYYIEVTDRSGMTTTDDNAGEYYSYFSTDSVDPTISISSPSTGITVEGDVEFGITASDGGAGSSGIAYVEVWSGKILLNNDSASPFNFTWDSRLLSNGTKNIGVFAYDSAGNLATDNISLNIQNDVAPPVTYGLQINPSTPEYGEEVTVSIISEDLNGVKNVTLYYAAEQTALFTGAQTWVTVEMEKLGILYTGTIPAQDYGFDVYYYVVAYDEFEQPTYIGSESEPLEYFVRDTQNPAMSVQAPSTAATLAGSIQFSISAHDEGSGVEEIRFYVDGTLTDDTIGHTTTFLWDTTAVENGNHTVEFVASDGAGNEVSISLEYEVQNPDAIGGALQSLSGFMARYGVFVGLAGGIILVLIIQRFLRKRGK